MTIRGYIESSKPRVNRAADQQRLFLCEGYLRIVGNFRHSLGCNAVRKTFYYQAHCIGRDVHNATITTFLHARRERAACKKDTFNIDRHGSSPFGEGNILERRAWANAGIVDDDVTATEVT